MYADESSLTIFLVLWGVWAVLGLGLYLWYLAALAALFPRLGLPAGEGWIPVWNESRILQRGGFSPWLVLLMFVPGISVAFVVLRAMAIHRIHTEYGKRAGLTVLAVLIPPLWATMLSAQLRDAGYGSAAAPHGAAPSYAAPGQNFAAPGYPTPAQPASAQQGYAPAQATAMQATAMQTNVAQATPAQASAAQQGYAPAHQGYAPAQPAAYTQTVEPSPWAAPPAVQLNHGPDDSAAPASPAAYPGQADTAAPVDYHPGPAVAPGEQALPDLPAFETLGFDSLMAQAPQGATGSNAITPDHASPSPFTRGPEAGAAPGVPAFADPATSSWGFGRETEEAYQQLSTQEVQPLSLSFTPEPQAVEPFTWPGTVEDVPPVPRAAEPFPVPESAWAAPVAEAQPAVESAAPAELPGQAGLAQTQAPVSVPAAETGIDDDLDHTVFVNRAPRERWVLELPDGSLLPLPSNDVIVGRRPDSAGDSSVLVIPDSTRTLSKSHVRLHVIDGAWVVTDLASTNGLAVIDELGEELVVAAGVSEPATEEMMFGTLRVRLRLVALDG